MHTRAHVLMGCVLARGCTPASVREYGETKQKSVLFLEALYLFT